MGCTNCGNGPKITCGERTEAACVFVEMTLLVWPDWSAFEDTCATAEDLFEELYEQVIVVTDEIDIKDISTDCLTIAPGVVLTVKNVIPAQIAKICELEARIAVLEAPCAVLATDISGCNLDISCLNTDPCNNPVVLTTMGALLQSLITKVCENEQL